MRFGFLINEVLTGLRRNVTMTVAMILTTAISIGLFGGGLLVVRAGRPVARHLPRPGREPGLPRPTTCRPTTRPVTPTRARRCGQRSRTATTSARCGSSTATRRTTTRSEVPAVQGRRGQGRVPGVVRRQARRSRAAPGLRRGDGGPARRAQRAQPEGPDRPAVRGARRHVQRRVRGRVGAGDRRGAVDRQHGSGRRLHPAHRDRHHAAGGCHAAGTRSCRSWWRRCWRR